MSALLAPIPGIPTADHRSEEDLPFVKLTDGVEFQLLQADIDLGLWIVRTKFDPGTTIQRHRHTGMVFAYTTSGAWRYLEYPEINRPGSYLYEPAGSIHTLHALADTEGPTDVFFAIYGANLNLDDDGNVESVVDAGSIRDSYFEECEKAGIARPSVIGC
ncbi:MAG: 2,4'-dihydroxyacetophenone dioxygenase [Gammaproteobacteria bacterium]|jgi:2,4'-dihydroxyacetophenone dioxygenase